MGIKLQKIAPALLRLGLVFVFMWFGLNQLLNPIIWTSLVPEWVISLSGISANTLVIISSIFEMILSIFLAFGVRIKIVAMLLFLHLGIIVIDLGLSAIGVRDIGLMLATLSVAFYGADEYSYDFTSKQEFV